MANKYLDLTGLQELVSKIKDYISDFVPVKVIETGINNNWHYKKYSDNTFEAWISTTVTPSSSTVAGSLYYTNQMSIALPFGNITAYSVSAGCGSLCWLVNPSISGNNFRFYLMRHADPSTQTGIALRIIMNGTYNGEASTTYADADEVSY